MEKDCCTSTKLNGASRTKKTSVVHPDHALQLPRLNRVRGQIDGIKRMIEDRRYCPDILIQTRALASALRTIEMSILETHVRSCVSEALLSEDPRASRKKVQELMDVLNRF